MAIRILRGEADTVISVISSALDEYESDHPQAEIDLYRQNPVSIRVRIVDPGFDALSKPERSAKVWRYLSRLPEEAQGDISSLLLLTPQEKKTSFANFEYEDPIPSRI